MQLSLHADYALRVLIYLGTHEQKIARTQDISDAYGISKNHLVRVVQTLSEHGYVRIHAGRFGGVSLGQAPKEIRLGQVVRQTEPNFRLVECFDTATNTCPIIRACTLKRILSEALEAFVATLDEYTLADVLKPGARREIAELLAIEPVQR
jgi:Rrf2 family nitric oxide-sensitive transcriptional repressor